MKLARLRLFGRLDRYIGALFVASYATAFMLVVGLAVIMDLAGHLDFFEAWEDGSRAPSSLIARYYLLNVPFLFLQVGPFVTVIAALFTVSRLVKNNEVVAALDAGVSAQRLLFVTFLGGLCAALGMFALRELCTEYFSYRRDALHDVLENQRYERVFEELWLRDAAGPMVRMGEFWPSRDDPPRAEIRDLTAVDFAGDAWTEQAAARATWVATEAGPRWLLDQGFARVEAETTEVRRVDYLEGLAFTPSDALLAWRGRERPMELSFSEVLRLLASDPDNLQLQTLLQYHLTFPLANVVLLLVALPFLVRHRRGGGAEGVTIGILLCVFYFSTDFTARSLGMEGVLSPLVAAWLPILLFGSLGAVLYEGMAT